MEGHQANGAFVACGPPGFTALVLINLGDKAKQMYAIFPVIFSISPFKLSASLTAQKLISPNAGEIWYAASVLGAVLLFGLAVFFFVFGALPYWFKVHKHWADILGCWALTF